MRMKKKGRTFKSRVTDNKGLLLSENVHLCEENTSLNLCFEFQENMFYMKRIVKRTVKRRIL